MAVALAHVTRSPSGQHAPPAEPSGEAVRLGQGDDLVADRRHRLRIPAFALHGAKKAERQPQAERPQALARSGHGVLAGSQAGIRSSCSPERESLIGL